jgi:hypothetical protein
VVEEISYSYLYDGGLLDKHTHKFDVKKNKYIPKDSLNFKYTYKYAFDETGNWLKKAKFEKGAPKYILEREIKYY